MGIAEYFGLSWIRRIPRRFDSPLMDGGLIILDLQSDEDDTAPLPKSKRRKRSFDNIFADDEE